MDEQELEVVFRLPLPFVIDNNRRIKHNAGIFAHGAGYIAVFKIEEISLVKAADFAKQLRSYHEKASGGVLYVKGLCVVLVEHCVFAQEPARLFFVAQAAGKKLFYLRVALAEDLHTPVGEADFRGEQAYILMLFEIIRKG